MQNINRRQFFDTIAKPAAVASVVMANPTLMAKALSGIRSTAGNPKDIARDESFWREIQQGYTADRSMINLNNGGVSPAPRVVQEAMKRHLDFSNTSPAYSMWRILEPQREPVRRRLARFSKCSPEEIALTRNASEGLQIVQNGLDLSSGDEVLTTTQDYGRMINTFKQRECRDGIVMKQFKIPVPAENDNEIVHLFEKNITPKTKMILMCHMINLTGQILPVKKVVRMARKYDIPVIVDGAHAFAHFDFDMTDLECDYYATSLHKWLCAPHGTGMLYVRKNKIPGLWPLQASNECGKDDIRKFEEIGTHPAANYLAIGDALTFHQGIGSKNKEARLTYLRDRWAKRLLKHDGITLHTSLNPKKGCAIATVQIEGIETSDVAKHLWSKYRIFVVAINHKEFTGCRVTPHVYTTIEEIDRFSDAMETILKNGV
ncbi:MAG: aminotransferase class V-fold PLP-dependent enzyme [Candidatus Marinimicrobia bacterium]|jgi:selenocysteine lyase/cysteine desulfurase|nr:aminotransferase class V-fold PLP-dependent enzyme [Candidatus Neomarinimicrobiota bacterium]MBT4307924.1 aminotransferase class V-fold PLP-dependent enzyme [Candidatus Neomarinimicrobiota bacterium]MBT4453124.1 aminotransferase class V-fold PLP-dependent enzyme [Candidatus Neomarinimicrobiota bacterium]MBT5386486.1 aminotransferase class V-fold PLP-dependent enzyme [Candidatus Neomarinimicrobiota bacterium]MBT6943454.1 aminotransferase class V-fold PLP-dependent enzyme [Candidatus Neomarini